MSDPTVQLRALGDAAATTVEPVTASDVLQRASDIADISHDAGSPLDIDRHPNQNLRARPRRLVRRTSPRYRRAALTAAAVFVLLIGATWLVTRDSSRTSDLAIAPPLASQQAEPSGPPVILRNNGSPIGEQLAALDLGGFLVAIVDGRPIVYDLTTGDEVPAPDARGLSRGWIGTEGIVHNRESYGGPGEEKYLNELMFSTWDSEPDSSIDLDDNEGLAVVVRDEKAGLLVVTGYVSPTDFLGPVSGERFHIRRLDTGERQPLGLSQILAEDLFWSASGGPGLAREPQPLFSSHSGRIYDWSWSDGWSESGRGDVLASTQVHRLVEVCHDLEHCTRELRTLDGAVIADLSADPSFNSRQAASSPTGKFAQVAPTAIRIVDDQGSSSIYSLPFQTAVEGIVWIGDDHLMLWSSIDTPRLFNVNEGSVTELNFLVRAAGTQPQFIWLPHLDGTAAS